MDKYKFIPEHSSMIVKAVIEGYRQYIDHRKDRSEKMHISSAFAWTKGNFIESQIATTCVDYGFSYKTSTAGPTWRYLQFIHDESKSLFLIKNATYFNPHSFANPNVPIPGKGQGKSRTYLQELAKVNQYIEFYPGNRPGINRQEDTSQMSLLYVPEKEFQQQLELFRTEYEAFHIITYQLDNAHQISKVMHYIPNPADNIAYEIDDLSQYIYGAELTDEDQAIFAPESEGELLDPMAFDIGILEEEKEDD